MRVFAAGTLAFLLSLALTPVVRAVARRLDLVAAPRDDRWHEQSTAMFGGVAIFLAFLATFLAFGADLAAAYPIVLAASIVFAVGLVDDLVQVSPQGKLLGQLIAATLVVWFGLRLPWTANPVVDDLITIGWLVGITNAVNLLDNMDGLAGGVAAIAGVFLTIAFVLNDQIALALVPAALCGAALGFLVYNFKPATIFMGDCGALFLGCALAGTALLSEYGRSRNVAAVILTPVLILMIPILDTCLVTVTRKLSGRPVSQGGRDHTSHRLVALGASERRAVMTLYVLSASSGAFALWVRLLETDALLLLLPGFALLTILFALYVGAVRIHGESRGAIGPSVSPRQRVVEVLGDVVVIGIAYYGAYLLRWDSAFPEDQRAILVHTLPIVLLVEMTALYAGGVYRELWRYARVEDLLIIGRSALLGAGSSAGVVLLMYGGAGPSRAVLVLNALLLLILATASRLFIRLLDTIVKGPRVARPGAVPVLIYGAGDHGALLVRQLLADPKHTYAPVGFIDDDAGKAGLRVHGLRIFGTSELPSVVETHGVSEVLVSSAAVAEESLASLRTLGVFPRRMSLRFD